MHKQSRPSRRDAGGLGCCYGHHESGSDFFQLPTGISGFCGLLGMAHILGYDKYHTVKAGLCLIVAVGFRYFGYAKTTNCM
ncbi:hypothetical protein ASPTUDRAFT_440712 [Aspergillus tubingensis CBS 134.48]|uniref:Uncharacterized protein n=1 Tax=Aspergillus tubingensis (strain CBS 134.48) TaxID=767770 RepID=A0A1L9N9G1_ASPTC|nr:hypothetical protein ASPTUDRAFT_440712 [Aspergillus tubingensis CBS 134.48]